MKRSGGSNSKIVLGILTSLVAFVVVLFLMFNSGIDSLMTVSGWIVIPVQNAFNSVSDSISDFFSGFGDNIEMKKKYDELLNELEKYRLKDDQYEQILQENERLRDIINERSRYSEYQCVIGEVTISKSSAYVDNYTINRGRADGIEENMVVVASGGLAGRVVSVSEHYCIMMSILDSRSSVPAIVERTRDTGVVKGYSSSGEVQTNCTMTYLPFEFKSMTGDIVKTSGNDDVFPKGIHIGSIVEITSGDTTLGATAKVVPAVDFDHLEYVIIITGGGEVLEETTE